MSVFLGKCQFEMSLLASSSKQKLVNLTMPHTVSLTFSHILTHYQTTNFRLKQFADDNFKFGENGRKLFKQVENTVGKGEIARYEQLLLFPQCFQKACFPGASKGVIVWEWVNNIKFIKAKSFNGEQFLNSEAEVG